jgi:hypothetical protein
MQRGGVLARWKHRVRVNARYQRVRENAYFWSSESLMFVIIILSLNNYFQPRTIALASFLPLAFAAFAIGILLKKIPGEDYYSGYLKPYERASNFKLIQIFDRFFIGDEK